ncbi:MAG: NIPSNAP family protein [Pseudomonadota bacterium]
MIVEMRSYRIRVGQVPAFIGLMDQEGIAIEKSILGHLIGFYSSDIGALNKVVHLWAYESFGDREKRRAQLSNSPVWQAFVPKVLPLIEEMENTILTPAPFSPCIERMLKET